MGAGALKLSTAGHVHMGVESIETYHSTQLYEFSSQAYLVCLGWPVG